MSDSIRKVPELSDPCGKPLPLSAFPIVSTHDPDQAESIVARQLVGVHFERVEDRQRFSMVMNGVQLGDALFAFNRFGTDTVVDGGRIDGAVVVSVGVGAPMVSEVDGERVSYTRNAVIFSPPRRGIHHRAAAGGEFTLRIGAEDLHRRLEAALDRYVRQPIRFGIQVDLESVQGRHLRSLIRHLGECAESDPAILESPLIRAGYDDLVVSWLLGLPSNYSEELRGDPIPRVAPEVVRRAEEFLEAHVLEPVTIDRVVAECGCSRRALFDAFRRSRGYTPMEFLRNRRLDRARLALQQAPPGATVASVAHECGFAHLGRFAGAYRRRFGELPGDTLRS